MQEADGFLGAHGFHSLGAVVKYTCTECTAYYRKYFQFPFVA